MPLRLGVEYLPPRSRRTDLSSRSSFGVAEDDSDEIRVEGRFHPIATPVTVHDNAPAPIDVEPSPWNRSRRELEQIEDDAERLTMLFVNDLVGEDRRRMRQAMMTPLLSNRLQFTMHESLRLPDDEQRFDEESEFFNRAAQRVIRRPLRKLLKRATFIEKFELALDEFKADNLPLSSAYREKNGREHSWGRVSMRVRLSDGSDPLELSYYNFGWRFGSSKERGRIQYRLRFADRIDGAIRYRFSYVNDDTALRADLRYIIDDDTTVYFVAGDTLDFLSGPTAYSFVNSPLDGSAGALFYVEHNF